MNNAIQFLNKSILLSICLHLIGVGIVSLSIVGTPDTSGDAIVAAFISLPEPQKTVRTPRRLKTPERTRPDILRAQPPRIRTLTEVPHIQQKTLQFVVDTLPISTMPQTTPAEIGTGSERGLQYPLPLPIAGSVSQLTRFTPKGVPRPQWSSVPLAMTSTQAAELPPISALLLNEPTQNAKFFRKVDPIYPESARLSHKQGLVVLEATIGVDGIARNIRVVKVVEVSGLGCEEAAIAALKASQFVPAKQGKVVVSQRLRIPYRFQFKSKS